MTEYITGLLGGAVVILAYVSIAYRIKLLHKSAEFNDISEKYSELQLKHAITESKFADTISGAAKAESEKLQYQEAIRVLERELSALKASSAAKEESLNERIQYLEKMKEELSLKFKDISNEIIKAQHESFSNEQKNTLSNILNPFSEQLKAFKSEVNTAREAASCFFCLTESEASRRQKRLLNQ